MCTTTLKDVHCHKILVFPTVDLARKMPMPTSVLSTWYTLYAYQTPVGILSPFYGGESQTERGGIKKSP